MNPLDRHPVAIEPAQASDLDEILAVQKDAFRAEVELFGDASISPYVQTIESVGDDFKSHVYLKALSEGKIVGAIRAYEKDRVCHIGRLCVHPDHHNAGVGRALVSGMEEHFKHCALYSLFAAKRVTKNIQLYSKLGYVLVKEEMGSEGLVFVYFEKRNE